MLALINRTPYAAERGFVRDNRGVDHWVVAVQATYDLSPGKALALADEQRPLRLIPEYWGEPGSSSVRYEGDIALMKPNTDVLVNGSACAPGGKPTPEFFVRLRVEDRDKTLRVLGPRTYYRGVVGLTTTEPLPFERLPLTYEAAYGGSDTMPPDPSRHRLYAKNPVGCGFCVDADHLENRPAPRVLYAEGDEKAAGPAGFGAIASYWSPRLELGGTYDARWEAEQRPLLPRDWSPEALLCAPADQRPASYLHGGERVELVHMTLDGVLSFVLPKVYLTFSTHFGRAVEEHRSRLVTVVVDTDAAQLLLVWQTTLAVPLRKIDLLDHTVIAQKPYLT